VTRPQLNAVDLSLVEDELGGRNFEDLVGDAGLAGFIVSESEIFDEALGVVGGALHGDHSGALLGGACAEERLIDREMDVGGEDGVEDFEGAGFELNAAFKAFERSIFVLKTELVESGEWQEGEGSWNLGEGINETGEQNRDLVDGAV